jgi:hypothetical protein
MRTLFEKTPAYVIDTCSINEFLQIDRKYPKDVFKSLWDKVYDMMLSGEIISHEEVRLEIEDGGIADCVTWIKEPRHKTIFKDYDYATETKIISTIGARYPDFLHQKKLKPFHADPWLVAQAKAQNLTVITEENQEKGKIPDVCKFIGVDCVNILGLIRKNGWVL